MACCDTLNAMTTDRPYRRALPLATAIEELRRCAGTQFDPEVVDVVLALLGEPGFVATTAAPGGSAPQGHALPLPLDA